MEGLVTMAKENMVKSTKKIFMILEELAKNGGKMKLKDISSTLGFPPSTTHRLLNTLIELGYVEQDQFSSGYNLGVKILSLASSSLNGLDLGQISYNHLCNLRDNTGETANIAVNDHNESLYIQKAESTATVRVFSLIGKRAPLHATGVGKVMMSDMPIETVEEIMTKVGMPRITNNTITSFDALKEELLLIKERGYAFDDEECELGAFCVAAPIRDYTGSVIASISVSVPTNRLNEAMKNRLIKGVTTESVKLSKKLGFTI